MRKKILIIVSILCSSACLSFAQSTTLRFKGLKSQFAATASLNNQAKEHRDIIQVKAENNELIIKKIIPTELYLLGANEIITLFVPVEGRTMDVEIVDGKFKFTGEGAKLNEYLQTLSYDLFYSYNNTFVNSYMPSVLCSKYVDANMEIMTNENYVEKVRSVIDQSLMKLKKAKLKNEKLEAVITTFINDTYWNTIVSTYMSIAHSGEKVPQSLLKTIDGYDFDSPDFLSKQSRNMILNTYLRVQEDLGRIEYTLNDYIARKAQCIKNSDVRDYYLLREFERLVKSKEFIYINELIASGRPLVSEKKREQYEQIANKINVMTSENRLDGVPAMGFTFENQDGEKVSLSDFRGKYVYIDVWATWCGPCKQEIPKLKALEESMKEHDDIVFVSLSVDRPNAYQEWKSFLKANDMKGITIATRVGFNDPFIQKYGINAIPRFMLIGPDGTMIANNCWRPSDPRLKTYLLSLIEKK